MDSQDNHLVYSFPKGKGEEIQVAIRTFKGKHYIDLRQWFQGKNEATFLPTKKGVSFPLELITELRKAVERLSKAVVKFQVKEPDEF